MAICAQRKVILRAKKKKKKKKWTTPSSAHFSFLHTTKSTLENQCPWFSWIITLRHNCIKKKGEKNNNIKLTNWYSSCWKRPQIDFIRRGRLPDDDHRLEVLFFHYMIRGGRYRSTTLLLLLLLSHLLPPGRNVSIQSNLNSDIVGLLMIIILHINSLDALIFCSGFLELVCAIKPACNHARNDKH